MSEMLPGKSTSEGSVVAVDGRLSCPSFFASQFTPRGTWQERWQFLPCNIDFIRATRQENHPILIAPKETTF